MSKPRVNEACIQESRAFFGKLLTHMVENISSAEDISKSDRKSLNILQTVWIKKYDPNRRMPDKLPVVPERIQVKKRKFQNKSPEEHQKNTSLIAKINIFESDFEELQKVNDNERIAMEIAVPQINENWKSATYMVTVPAHVAKGNKMEPLLTMNVLRTLMHAPSQEANRLLQVIVDNEFNSEIDDALMHG